MCRSGKRRCGWGGDRRGCRYAARRSDRRWAALKLPAIQGEVRFGAPYDIIGSYAPAILRRFGRAFPAIRVTLVCKDSVLLLSELKAGASSEWVFYLQQMLNHHYQQTVVEENGNELSSP